MLQLVVNAYNTFEYYVTSHFAAIGHNFTILVLVLLPQPTLGQRQSHEFVTAVTPYHSYKNAICKDLSA